MENSQDTPVSFTDHLMKKKKRTNLKLILHTIYILFNAPFYSFIILKISVVQDFFACGGSQHRGKTSFVEHRTFLHLYHSFHRLWIFLFMMFQVSYL